MFLLLSVAKNLCLTYFLLQVEAEKEAGSVEVSKKSINASIYFSLCVMIIILS